MTDRAVPAPRRLLAVTLLAAAGLYLLGNGTVSLWDRDEPRYAQTSRQMLQSGDWVVPRFLDRVRTAKPVFIYWCQASAMRVFGDNTFAARLPSAVAMVLTLGVVAGAVWRHADPRRAVWTAFILGTSALAVMSAKMSTTDAVLLLWITIAQVCLYAMWRGHATWPVVVTLAFAVGLAGLTKGPVVLGVMGMTLLALGAFRGIEAWIGRRRERQSRRAFEPVMATAGVGDDRGNPSLALHRGNGEGDTSVAPTLPNDTRSRSKANWPVAVVKFLVAVLIVAAVVGPWLYLVHRRETSFLGTSVSHDVFSRIAKPLEGHRGPPGYHLALVFATFLPWSLLLPMAVVSGWKHRHVPQVRFALAAVLGPWLMFEIVQTKLPHYLLPVFPALAFLTADVIVRALDGRRGDFARRGFIVGAAVWAAALVMMGLAPWLASLEFDALPWAAMVVLSVVAVVYATSVLVSFLSNRPVHGLVTMGVGFVVVLALLFGLYLPRAPFLRLSINAAALLNRHRAADPGAAAMLDYKEPSLAFYEGGTIRENRATKLTPEVLDAAPPWMVVTDQVLADSPPEGLARVREVGRVKGLAYADGGRVVEVVVVRKVPDGSPGVRNIEPPGASNGYAADRPGLSPSENPADHP